MILADLFIFFKQYVNLSPEINNFFMPKVTFKNKGVTSEARSDELLKEVVKKSKWSIPFACEDGVCGTCLIKTAPGEKNLSPMEDKENVTLSAMGMNDGNHRLACQCKVKGDLEIEQE